MKRVLIVAVSAALLSTALAGAAVAQFDTEAPVRVELRSGGEDAPDIGHILRRCLRLLGEDRPTDQLEERCLELWKRWCNAHPDARYCHRPHPRPHDCRITDHVIDRRCLPDRPSDRPVDRPSDRPVDRPTDRPVTRPHEGPPETAELDRDRLRDPISDRATNGIHLRTRAADL